VLGTGRYTSRSTKENILETCQTMANAFYPLKKRYNYN
jgi:hypothetical protein